MLFCWTEDPLWPGPVADAWFAAEVYDAAVKRGEDDPGNTWPAPAPEDAAP